MSTGEVLDKQKMEAPIDRIGMTPKEQEYFRYLQKRLQAARDARDQTHQWFDGMTFMQYLENNERMWNATIEPKTDSRDWRSRARKRTIFQKGNAILGKLMDERFMTEFAAYDADNELDEKLGYAMTSAVQYTKDIEHSEEVEYLAGLDLLKHGFVAVQEVFEVSRRPNKELQKIDWTLDARPDNRTWKQLEDILERRCRKYIIRPDSLYLGNLFTQEFQKQPYIFMRSYKSYEVAKAIFGKFDRWKFVRPGAGGQDAQNPRVPYLDQWRLGSISEDEVEIIEYQDKWNDEYNIIINGVLMLPVGFPLPWSNKEYNVSFRVLYPISAHCAYGHGLCHVMRSNAEIRDFLMRYAVDKTFQDLLPPMVTKAKRALSSVIWIPGRITHDLSPDEVAPLVQPGIPSSASQMLQFFESNLDQDSIAKIVEGQDSPGSATAFEVQQQMKAAFKTLGPVVFAFTWLIRDMDYRRLENILDNLARPKDKKLDPQTKELVDVYERLVLEDTDLPDGTRGTHVIEFTEGDSAPDPFEIFKAEVEAKAKKNKEVRYSYVNADFVRDVDIRWAANVKSSPRVNSDVKKLLLGEFIRDVMGFFGPSVNMEYLQGEYAKTWDKDPTKLFAAAAPAMPEGAKPGKSSLPQQAKNAMVGEAASMLGAEMTQ